MRTQVAVFAFALAACRDRAHTDARAQPPPAADVVIECSTLGGVTHILRVSGDGRTAEDLSFAGRTGTAEVTDGEYRMRFNTEPTGYHVLFRINRYTGEGYRQLTDQDGHLVSGPGGNDSIKCSPYTKTRL
jgi:hypothetical protein